MSMVASPNPKVTLRVNDQGGGPVIYARFRRDATHAELALGRGWLVPSESELAKPKGKVIGGWVERRGRPTDGALSVDRAWQSVPDVIGRYLRKAEVEAHQRRTTHGRDSVTLSSDGWPPERLTTRAESAKPGSILTRRT
jgi:hypothetical protein